MNALKAVCLAGLGPNHPSVHYPGFRSTVLTPLPLLPIPGYGYCGIDRMAVRLQIVDIVRE